jgi:hypothetical protein
MPREESTSSQKKARQIIGSKCIIFMGFLATLMAEHNRQ